MGSIEYDIVAHTYDFTMVPSAFMRAVMENVLVTTRWVPSHSKA